MGKSVSISEAICLIVETTNQYSVCEYSSSICNNLTFLASFARFMRLDVQANKCFVCGPGNASGLNIRFRLDGDTCRAEWQSSAAYMGYDGVTHGGILFCLLDDVMANLLFLKGEVCVTAKADVRFREPLGIGEMVRLESCLERRRGALAVIRGLAIRVSDDAVVAEATGHFMVKQGFSAGDEEGENS